MQNALPSQSDRYDEIDEIYRLISLAAACDDPIRVTILLSDLEQELKAQKLPIAELIKFFEFARSCEYYAVLKVITDVMKKTRLQRRDPDRTFEKEAKNSAMREVFHLMQNGLLPAGA